VADRLPAASPFAGAVVVGENNWTETTSMATWPDLRSALERVLHVESVGDDLLVVSIQLNRGGRQQVGIRHEMVPQRAPGPEFWYVSIDSVICRLGAVDLIHAIDLLGKLAVGHLGYVQGNNGTGLLTVGSKMPVATVDLRELSTLCMQIQFIGEAAFAVGKQLTASDEPQANQADEARDSAWQLIREDVLRSDDIAVERDYGDGFIFMVEGTESRHRLFASKNSRGPGLDYFTFEAALGRPDEVDLLRAVQAAERSLGGVVCQEGMVTFRESHHMTSLTPRTFKVSLADLIVAAENYQNNRR
jgi:hypothetical protein